jgi:hypothetical protein
MTTTASQKGSRARFGWVLTLTGLGSLIVALSTGDLITAGPQSPLQFARAALKRLGLASERNLEAYEAPFHRGDRAAFPLLMQEQGAS